MSSKQQFCNSLSRTVSGVATAALVMTIVLAPLALVGQSPGVLPTAGSIPNRALVTVDSHAGPWLISLNPGYDYGIHDNSGPTIVNKANSGIDFVPGKVLTIIYVSGLVSAGAAWPFVDANGDVKGIYGCGDGLLDHGTSGTAFPCIYTDTHKKTFLMELMGVFTDSNGVIVGKPFTIGDGPYQMAIPAGATQLQMGINDDIYWDNMGSFQILVAYIGPNVLSSQ